jgi:hypothetical protein
MDQIVITAIISVAVSVTLAYFYNKAKAVPPQKDGESIIFPSTVKVFVFSPSLRISTDGVHQDGWGPFNKKITWEEIVDLELNTGDGAFTVKAKGGRKIKHTAVHAARDRFAAMIQKRTKLPMTIATPGIWKVKRTSIPYDPGLNQ